MTPHVLALSPHRDDAALSLAATLAAISRAGARLTIVSCFTQSAWAPRASDSLTVAEISALRAREDAVYAAKLGENARVVSLDMVDAPLRRESKSVFELGEATELDAEVAELRTRLRDLAIRDEDVLLAPLAVIATAGSSGHVDHVIARTAVATADRQNLGFYDDVPYVFSAKESDVTAQVTALENDLQSPLTTIRCENPSAIATWQQAASHYDSQFSHWDMARMSTAMQARGGERLRLRPQLAERLGPLLAPG